MKCFETLKQRGYVYQLTHEEEIIKLLNGDPITFYLGIDPTADSLHIGHFFALSMARWLQDFGHNAIILIGGATALIGDPTGKSDMRSMLTKEQVEHNKKEVKDLVKRFVKEDTLIVDNADWFKGRDYVDFMREVGVHFNVKKMLSADCYKKRLENGGLTFLEMGYMLMQAFDFTILKDRHNCVLQIGGSDQWANIVAGVDLGRKFNNKEGKEVEVLFGLTCPLLVKADGEKMGKTASGTLWVSRNKTDCYDFYQAFINVFDEDVERLLSFFTRIEIDEIKAMCEKDIISAKKLMAFEVTKLVHGEEEAIKVKEASEAVFSGANTENMPTVFIAPFEEILVTELLVATEITTSKGEARRLIEGNGLSINKEKVTNADKMISKSEFIDGQLLIQKGKKTFVKVKFNS
ncbi:MAG: tyrosine--tRNA ligase [Mollicutes bacterium]|jgi:tyrosyl-tRNA synthetase|nr:tyrosine--tRNA ligase [Mollicutes bacterium]